MSLIYFVLFIMGELYRVFNGDVDLINIILSDMNTLLLYFLLNCSYLVCCWKLLIKGYIRDVKNDFILLFPKHSQKMIIENDVLISVKRIVEVLSTIQKYKTR